MLERIDAEQIQESILQFFFHERSFLRGKPFGEIVIGPAFRVPVDR